MIQQQQQTSTSRCCSQHLIAPALTPQPLQELITSAIDRSPRCAFAAKVVDKLEDLCLQRRFRNCRPLPARYLAACRGVHLSSLHLACPRVPQGSSMTCDCCAVAALAPISGLYSLVTRRLSVLCRCRHAMLLTQCAAQAAWWSLPTVLWTLFLTPMSRWLLLQRRFPSLFCRQHAHHHSARPQMHAGAPCSDTSVLCEINTRFQ